MIKGSKRDLCTRGLHTMTVKVRDDQGNWIDNPNVWIRKNDGARYCRECQKARRHGESPFLTQPMHKVYVPADVWDQFEKFYRKKMRIDPTSALINWMQIETTKER
jgi:hypothetical protein